MLVSSILVRFSKDKSGATAIECGLSATLIGVAIIAGATALGSAIGSLFTALGVTMSGQATA